MATGSMVSPAQYPFGRGLALYGLPIFYPGATSVISNFSNVPHLEHTSRPPSAI